jgi:hypothetical protein
MGVTDVHINGDKADEAFKQLKESTSLKLTRDETTGKVTATGKAKTDADKKLLAATTDAKVDVRINATTTNKVDGGAFQGSVVKDGVTITSQTVDPAQTKIIDNFYKSGSGVSMLHEVLESYIGGANSPGSPAPTYSKTSPGYDNYLKAHNEAMATDPRFKAPNISREATGTKTSISLFPYDDLIKNINPETPLHN